nr:multidrug resistance-associated protein 5 [Tanacetum cinerariifolium]
MEQIKAANPSAYQFSIDKDPKTWSKVFFKLDKGCEAIENGFSECFNSVLVSVRNKPLLTMLEAIKVIVIERMNTMRKISATWTDDICPSILKRIDLMKNHTRFWHVIHTSGESFEVRSGSDALKPRIMPGRLRKKRIRASHEGGSGTRVSKVGGQVTCQNYFQIGHNKKGWLHLFKNLLWKKKVERPRKADAINVGGSATPLGGFGVGRTTTGLGRSCVGRNATGLGRSGVGRSASGVGLNANGLGRSANPIDDEGVNGSGVNIIDVGGSANVNMGYDNVFMGSTNMFVGSASGVGRSVQGTCETSIGRGVVRTFDIPGLKWSPPHKSAFNRVGGIRFSTRPTGLFFLKQIKAIEGNHTVNQAILYVQRSQTKVEIPTQEMPSQAANEVPPEVQRVR